MDKWELFLLDSSVKHFVQHNMTGRNEAMIYPTCSHEAQPMCMEFIDNDELVLQTVK